MESYDWNRIGWILFLYILGPLFGFIIRNGMIEGIIVWEIEIEISVVVADCGK